MKKSELRKMIKEELLKEASNDFVTKYKGVDIFQKNLYKIAKNDEDAQNIGDYVQESLGEKISKMNSRLKSAMGVSITKIIVEFK